ncbi:MAG: gliding motility lipoprotein GldH [Bacteroidales bacterium]|nr:gliding motility lipoprotein GldH [Bacteroidales bacterium]MBN2818542.1 gliding motility lipoprotein GldH [Bacteroidales bacterium]
MKNRIIYFSATAVFFFLIACTGNVAYDDVQKVDKEGWQAGDVFSFNVPVADTASAFDILIHIRNNNNYEYSNLWLFIDTKAPNGNHMRDTVEFILADPSGKWLGKGLGAINTMLIPYKPNIKFPNSGIYIFDIQQGMRKETLENIMDVGVRVQKR